MEKKNSQKTMKLLIGAGILVALAIIGSSLSGSQKNTESESQIPSLEENKAMPDDTKSDEVTSPSNSAGNQTDAGSPVKESTPAERADRTTSPSDAASYSEDDLPPDYSEVP